MRLKKHRTRCKKGTKKEQETTRHNNKKKQSTYAQNSAQNNVSRPGATGMNGFQCKWKIKKIMHIIIPANAWVSAPKDTKNTDAANTKHLRTDTMVSQ